MRLIRDVELAQLVQKGQLVQGIVDIEKQIKGCSVDLTIGSIYVPGSVKGALGSVDNPRRDMSLGQGETAVVRTEEIIVLDSECAGVAFPASGVSLQGLLMTNPGHVDPGYRGHLHVTVINMGKDPYTLNHGGRLLRSLFVKFEQPVRKLFVGGRNPIDEELLSRLSPDFLSVEIRAQAAAKRAVDHADFRSRALQIVVPVLVALLGIGGTWLATSSKVEERIALLESRVPNNLDGRMTRVEALAPVESRLQVLELDTVKRLDQRILKLESLRREK